MGDPVSSSKSRGQEKFAQVDPDWHSGCNTFLSNQTRRFLLCLDLPNLASLFSFGSFFSCPTGFNYDPQKPDSSEVFSSPSLLETAFSFLKGGTRPEQRRISPSRSDEGAQARALVRVWKCRHSLGVSWSDDILANAVALRIRPTLLAGQPWKARVRAGRLPWHRDLRIQQGPLGKKMGSRDGESRLPWLIGQSTFGVNLDVQSNLLFGQPNQFARIYAAISDAKCQSTGVARGRIWSGCRRGFKPEFAGKNKWKSGV